MNRCRNRDESSHNEYSYLLAWTNKKIVANVEDWKESYIYGKDERCMEVTPSCKSAILIQWL